MELLRALGVLSEPPGAEGRRLGELLGLGPPPDEAAWSDLFLFQLYPYASVYLGAEGMLGGEARDRIAGFWRALGFDPPAEPDHLAALLGLYVRLRELEAPAGSEAAPAAGAGDRWRHARKALLYEHLLSWLPAYLVKLAELDRPYFGAWGRLLAAALGTEAAALGAPEALPLALREAPEFPDPAEEGGPALLRALLAPARCGMILVRDDLTAVARRLGIGARIGERRFVLEALLAQDARGTLGWLADEARRWSRRHREGGLAVDPIATFWAGRARSTAERLAVAADAA